MTGTKDMPSFMVEIFMDLNMSALYTFILVVPQIFQFSILFTGRLLAPFI